MDIEPADIDHLRRAQSPARRWRVAGAELVAWAKTLASAAVYATLIVTFGFQVARVEGRSMEPTLSDQDRLVVSKLTYQLHDPAIGDIVMVRHPNDPALILVKRVVAGPGDVIAIRDGQVMRNGEAVTEAFVGQEQRSSETRQAVAIPKGHYFVMGDHRNNSLDSRDFGPVPRKYILGKVELRWWPVASARMYQP